MPRPKKYRRVCSLPNNEIYGPIDKINENQPVIVMNVEEYETIRLIDYENFEQVQCAEIMGVARSTIQRIYDLARKKLAQSFVEGKVIKIEGGNYKVCEEDVPARFCSNCNRGRHRRGRFNKEN